MKIKSFIYNSVLILVAENYTPCALVEMNKKLYYYLYHLGTKLMYLKIDIRREFVKKTT